VLTKAPVPDIRLITRQLLLQELHIQENDLMKQLKRNFSLERAFEIIGRYFGISLEQAEEPLVELMNVLIYQHFRRNAQFSVDEWEDKWTSSAPNVCALFIEEWLQRSDKEVLEEHIIDWERVNRLREVLSQQELDHFTMVDTFPVVDAFIIEKCIDELLHQTIHVSNRLSLIEQRLQTNWGLKGQLNAIYNTLYQAIRLEQFKLTFKRMYQEDDLYESYAADVFEVNQAYRQFMYDFTKLESKERIDDIESRLIAQNIRTILEKEQTRVFVIISDALRYEAAHELHTQLEERENGTSTIQPMTASYPTYTQLGMASLLPHRELSVDGNKVIYA